jgi:hypothetical protein
MKSAPVLRPSVFGSKARLPLAATVLALGTAWFAACGGSSDADAPGGGSGSTVNNDRIDGGGNARPDDGDDPEEPDDSGNGEDGDASNPPPADSGTDASTGTARPYPAPDGHDRNRGPGGPSTTFTEAQLFQHCAYIDGGEGDTTDHHNLHVMYDGFLLKPWAPENGKGGFTFYDFSNACSPRQVGYGTSAAMRESHSIAFSDMGGRFAVVDGMVSNTVGGIQIWDVADTANPRAVSSGNAPNFLYPNAYARVTLSVTWQGRYIYAAHADNGIAIFDASDIRNPRHLKTYRPNPAFQVGQLIAIGNMLFASASEGTRSALIDISDPTEPRPIGGGAFETRERGNGSTRASYFSNTNNGYAYYARKQSGGGLIVYDIRNPNRPTYAGDFRSNGNGGYVFVKDNLAFVGESEFAAIYDISDLSNIREVRRMTLKGDLDTVTPIGNVAILSVDDGADKDKGSAVVPYLAEPDKTPPRVTWAYPLAGATGLATTSRFGLTFNEMIDVKSAWEGSVRLYETGTEPARTRVDGHFNVQEAIVNFTPKTRLKPNTQYTLEVPAGGIADYNGNRIEQPFTATFTTGPQ